MIDVDQDDVSASETCIEGQLNFPLRQTAMMTSACCWGIFRKPRCSRVSWAITR